LKIGAETSTIGIDATSPTDRTDRMNRHRRADTPLLARVARPRFLAACLGVALLAVGCVESSGEAQFEASGFRKFDSCLQSLFPLEPTFLATKDRIDSVGIFLQTEPAIGPGGDIVYLEVFDTERVTDSPETTLSFAYPPSLDPPARAKLAPWESCPDTNVSLGVEGTIRFDEFGTDSGDRMVGELVDGRIVDARTCSVDRADERTCEVVAESFSGSWDFDVEVTAPHRTYPTFEDEYRVEP
jgi:hypothetical protein